MWKTIITWMSKNWAWFKGFFSEIDGPSTTRALNWMWLIFLCGNLTFLSIYNVIKTHDAKLPPMESTSGYVAITSLLLASKVGQRIWGENPVTGQTDASGSMYSAMYSNMLASMAAQYSGSVTGSVATVPTPSPYVPVVTPVVLPSTPDTGSVVTIP